MVLLYKDTAVTIAAGITNAENGVKLSWKNVAGAVNYELYRKNSANDEWVLLATVKGNSYIDKRYNRMDKWRVIYDDDDPYDNEE